MNQEWKRRGFIGAAALAAGGLMAQTASAQPAAAQPAAGGKIRIIGIACSPRKGKTTAAALTECLKAAQAADPRIETELIELAGMKIPVYDPGAPADAESDFAKLAPKLSDAAVGGIIIGSPVYFNSLSSLCKAFLDQWMLFRKNKFALRNKVAGALAVGGSRNGGQELTVASLHAILLEQEMVMAATGQPSVRLGATLVNDKDSIASDEYGLGTARDLGKRVAELALKMAR